MSLSLSILAFMAPEAGLVPLTIISTGLLWQVRSAGGWRGLVQLFLVQMLLTQALYVLLYGPQLWWQASVIVWRLMLALVPGWWLAHRYAPEQTGAVFAKCLPRQWAFVLSAALSMLPYIACEAKEIWQIQRLRGAKVSLKHLRHPRHWREFFQCVLFPLLIALLKLARESADAAHCRHFHSHHQAKHQYWQQDKTR
ncbi:energy-coupling factor transporter transmembrane protein EcfT [Shewanella sp. NIFS-20-20]|nr:energy-coupling factor transporter transmembrane protein EcfT [Shewanella sp. NIFS-20-20]